MRRWNRLRLVLVMGIVLTIGLGVTTPVQAALAGHWSLDEGRGTVLKDKSGNGNTATLYDDEGDAWIAGKQGSALSFDGINDYAVTPAIAESASFTLAYCHI